MFNPCLECVDVLPVDELARETQMVLQKRTFPLTPYTFHCEDVVYEADFGDMCGFTWTDAYTLGDNGYRWAGTQLNSNSLGKVQDYCRETCDNCGE